MRKQKFSYIPTSLIFSHVSAEAVRMYGALSIFEINRRKRMIEILSEALNYNGNGNRPAIDKRSLVVVSAKDLASWLGCSLSKVRRAIYELRNTGWIEIISCPGRSNFYFLNNESMPELINLAHLTV